MLKFKNIPNFSPLPRVGEVGRRSCEGARQTLRSRDSRAGIRQKSPAAILTLLSRLPLTRSPSDLSHKGRGEILKFFGINIIVKGLLNSKPIVQHFLIIIILENNC